MRRSVEVRLLCLALLLAARVRAQDVPPAPPPQNLLGEDWQRTTGQISDPVSAGPSILSRDSGLLGQRAGKLIDLRLYGEMMGIYDSGLAPVPSHNGTTRAIPDTGVDTGAGVMGTRTWRHARMSVEYKGTFRQYARNSFLNGTDQFLDLAYTQLLTPHLTFDLKTVAGTTTMPNGDFVNLPVANTDSFALPLNELFAGRKNYAESRVTLVWQQTRRLSFDFGGEGFLVRRQYGALAGLNGYSARTGLAYRLTGRQTIGATFQLTNFDFQRLFGGAQLQTAALEYSVALSRSMDLALQAGGSRLNANGLTEVSLDPAVAATIGQNVAIVTFSRILFVPAMDARLMKRFRQSSLMLDYSSGIAPGNGLYLTSRQQSGRAAYSYTGGHRFTAALSAGYSQLAALAQNLPLYRNVEGGAGVTYRIAGDAYLELRYDYRHFTTQNRFYNLDSNRVSLGLAFSPGDTPLAIW